MSVLESQMPNRTATAKKGFLSKFAANPHQALVQENQTLQRAIETAEEKLSVVNKEYEALTKKHNEITDEVAQVQELLAQMSEQHDNMANDLKMSQSQVAGLKEQIAYIRRNLLSNSPFAVLMAERKDYPSSVEWQIIYLERNGKASNVNSITILRGIQEETKKLLNLLNQCKSGADIMALDHATLHETFIIEAV